MSDLLQVERVEANDVIEFGGDADGVDVPTDPGAGVAELVTGAGKPPKGDAPKADAKPEKPPEKAEAESEKKPDEGKDEAALAASWAQLKRQERDLWRREKAVKDAEREAKAKPAVDLSSPAAFIRAMESAGVSLEQLIDHHLETGDGKAKAETAENPDVAELKKWKAERERREAEAEAKATYDNGVKVLREELEKLDKDSGRFEMLLSEGAYDRVLAKLRAYHDEYGQPGDYLEAADEVEAELTAEEEARIERRRKLKKFASKYQTQEQAKPSAAKPSVRRTLTNQSGIGGGASANDDDALPMDPDARDRALKRRLYGG